MTEVHANILYSDVVDKRIEELLTEYEADEFREADQSEEYTELLSFRQAVCGAFSREAWDHGISFVSDSYWSKYAADHANDVYGEAANTEFWDADKYAEALQDTFTAFSLDGEEYWTTGDR
jgi:exonuclease I